MRPYLPLAALALLSACGGGGGGGGGPSGGGGTPTPTPSPTPTGYAATNIGTGSYSSMTFLPDGRAVYTQRDGTIAIGDAANPGVPTPVTGKIPGFGIVQGGVIDVIPDPDFTSNGYLYFSSTEGSLTTTVALTVVRAQLTGSGPTTAITNPAVIWRGDTSPIAGLANRFGGQLAFDHDGLLYLTVGDFGDENAAQDLMSTRGKVIRINRDGTPAAGNPFAGRTDARADIFSYGHRDPEGLSLGQDGRLYETEVGPTIGDEINVLQAGGNYGWPLVSEGKRADGTDYPKHSTRPDIIAPAYFWTSITRVADIIQVRSDRDDLGNAFLVASNERQAILRLKPNGTTFTEDAADRISVGSPTRILAEAPDGRIYGITYDIDGAIFRIDRK